MGFWPIPESYWPENTMNSLVFIIKHELCKRMFSVKIMYNYFNLL